MRDRFGAPMDDLVQFLHARLVDDEVAAKMAHGDQIEATPSLWGTKYLTLRGDHDDRYTTELPAELADHVARHDPARVLTEVEAKRRMIGRIDSHATIMGWDEVHGDLLRLLGLPYAGHPDYKDKWRP